jgi:type I restriction enzyme, S subunit
MSSEREMPAGVLGDYFDLQRGATYKSARLGQPGPVLLGLASIQRNGGFRADKLRTYGGDSPEKLLLEAGDMYVSLKDVTQSGDLLGAVARVPSSIPCGRLTQDTVKLIPKPAAEALLSYLFWLLRTPPYRTYCRQHAMGTTNLSMSRDAFLAYEVPLFTTARKHLIRVLEALDDRIESSARIASTAWEIVETLFAHRFGADWPARLLSGRQAPPDTSWATLGDLVELRYGKSLPAQRRAGGPVSVVGSSGVVGHHSASLVDRPAVIVGRKGTAGSIIWVDASAWPIDTTFYAIPRNGVSLEYVYFALRATDLPSLTADSAVPGLNRDAAYARPVCVPSPAADAAFAFFARRLMGLARSVRSEANTLRELRDGLLPKLVSGQTRVQAGEPDLMSRVS